MENSHPKIIIIGAGGIIGKQHTKVSSESPLVNLVAIIEPTPQGKVLSDTYNVPCFDSLDSFYKANINFDGAIVATPNSTHVPIGIELVQKHIHCLIEKPLSIDSTSAQLLVDEAAKHNVTISVGHHRRFSQYLRIAKETIDKGSLGQIVGFMGTWSAFKPKRYFEQGDWRKVRGSGGPILINLIHELDAFSYLFGPVARVYAEEGDAKIRNHPAEETVAVTLKYKSGIVGSFFLTDTGLGPYAWEPASGESYMFPESNQNVYTVFGTKGSMAIPELKRWHVDNKPNGELGDWEDKLQIDDSPAKSVPEFQDIYQTQVEHFAKVISGHATPRCDGFSGVQNLKTIEAIAKSLNEKIPIDIQ